MSAEHPSAVDREQPLDEILAAYLKAAEAGQPPHRQTLLVCHPDLAAELAAFFADFDRVEGLAVPLRAIRSAAPHAAQAASPRPKTDADTVDEKPATASSTPSPPKVRCPTCHNPIALGQGS